mmetsp:Transcript_24301/g.75005  ORF Transcript_24301/g.75005 Transcript_24301/m.75005 type:complete len:249 (+) Transcript_24301:288-1034(+)
MKRRADVRKRSFLAPPPALRRRRGRRTVVDVGAEFGEDVVVAGEARDGHVFWIGVEFGCVGCAAEFGEVGRGELLGAELVPVLVVGLEDFVALDLGGALDAEAVLEVPGEERPDEFLRRRRDFLGELDVGRDDEPEDRHGVVGVRREEGRPAHERLVHQHAVGPQVHLERVALAQDALRREVLRRPEDGPRFEGGLVGLGGVVGLFEELGEAEVDDFQVAGAGRHHDVLRLQVSVDDAVVMDVIDGAH